MGCFLFTAVFIQGLGPIQPPIKWVLGALTPGVKWTGHEANHSPSSSAKVKTLWNYTSTPQYVFMVWCLIGKEVYLHGVILS
jgi:hypothetical protein